MSFEEYQALPDGLHAEWVDGKAIIFMSTTDIHATVILFLARLIADFCDEFGLGRVLLAPYGMRLRADGPFREPDLMFVAANHRDRITRAGIQGPADIVIEVISDDSVARDRAEKFYEYQEGGVPEYWIYDPRPGKERADFYRLGETGKYEPIVPDDQGCYLSRVLSGFWLRLEWLRTEPLPMPKTALAEILVGPPAASS
jgi:Uma2 family endonuclease